jgi:hypothetical protein
MLDFQKYIFGLLPPYFKATDSYKDVNDKGLLERFLEALGMEWDERLIPPLENVNSVYTDTKFIQMQANLKGGLPQGNLSDAFYTKLVQNWIHILKVKGTKLAYQQIFYLYDPSIIVNITENFPVGNSRDTGEFPRDNPLALRDIFCRNCYNYSVFLTYDATNIPNRAKFEDDANYLISLIEPVNLKLTSLEVGYTNSFEDTFDLTGQEQIDISLDSNPEPPIITNF